MTRKLDVNLLTVNLLTGGGSLTYYNVAPQKKASSTVESAFISLTGVTPVLDITKHVTLNWNKTNSRYMR